MSFRIGSLLALGLFHAAAAHAQVAEACLDYAGPPPAGYDEQVQQDFLANHAALASTFSPLHGPIPHEPGHGAFGVDFAVMPPLGCERRFVLHHTKTEDTNMAPVIPRPRVSFAFPAIGPFIPYASVAYVPPVKVFGTTNVIFSGEIGVGVPVGEHLQVGGRFHATSQRTIGEIATPFVDGDPAIDDLLVASSLGVDLMAGWNLGDIVPYAALGITDVSTVFYVGDDGVVTNNLHPYFGPVFALGVDALLAERLRLAGEFYGAPGGYSLPDADIPSVSPASRYGHLYTARLRVAVEL